VVAVGCAVPEVLVGEVVVGAIGPVVAGRVVVGGVEGVEVGLTVGVAVGVLECVTRGTTVVGATVAAPLPVAPVGVAGCTSR
jgi:hypothetical protein